MTASVRPAASGTDQLPLASLVPWVTTGAPGWFRSSTTNRVLATGPPPTCSGNVAVPCSVREFEPLLLQPSRTSRQRTASERTAIQRYVRAVMASLPGRTAFPGSRSRSRPGTPVLQPGKDTVGGTAPPRNVAVGGEAPPGRRGGPVGRRLLLEDLVEASLQARRLLLDVVVVDGQELQRAQRRVAGRGLDVGPGRVDAFAGEELLHRVADHERGERTGGVRVRLALDHRRRRRDGEGAVGREEGLHLVARLPVLPRVGIGPLGRHQPLAALEGVRDLLVALHDHDVVGPELPVELPAVLLGEHP